MSDFEVILRYLGRDPVMQALQEAETAASNGLQHTLLDAVLADDHKTVRRLLEEEEHTRLLEDLFFLPLSIILANQSSPQVLEAFRSFGYDARTKPYDRRANNPRWGELAQRTCTLDRQRELLEAGFLGAREYAYAGMASANPAAFDLWAKAYFQDEASKPEAARRDSAPQATLAIFRWLPDAPRRQDTGQSRATRGELDRRLRIMVQGFLDLHYPASTPQERWQQFITKPPVVSTQASSAFESVVFMKVFVDHQLAQAPQLRDVPVKVCLDTPALAPRHATLAAALLQSGFSLASFQSDLVSDILQSCLRSLRKSENPSEVLGRLWIEVSRHLQNDDPERWQALPQELTHAGSVLALVDRWNTDEERLAFCQALEMQLGTPLSPRPSSRVRL